MIRSAMNDIPADRWDLAFGKGPGHALGDEPYLEGRYPWDREPMGPQAVPGRTVTIIQGPIWKLIADFYKEVSPGQHDYPASYVDELLRNIKKELLVST